MCFSNSLSACFPVGQSMFCQRAAIHHHNGSLLWMSVVECLERQHIIKNNTYLCAFYKSNTSMDVILCEIMHGLKGSITFLMTINIILIDRCIFK